MLLKQHAYDRLKDWIQDTTFEPGSFLSERQLASQLGMSKTPIKSALERLESEGFIAVSPQQGIVVRELSVHEIADQFEVRYALESFVLRSVSGKLTADEAARVQDNLTLQRAAAESTDVAACVALDSAFHIMFCEFLGNREIINVMSQLRDKIHRVISRVLQQDPGRLIASVEEHASIHDAVMAGNGELAATAIEEHLNYGRQFLLSANRR